MCRPAIWAGLRSIDPVMVPLGALEIVRSPMAGPLTPAATELCKLADVATDNNPSNEPLTSSLVPLRTADAEPDPARLARVLASAGIADRRALKVSFDCARSEHAKPPIAIAAAKTMLRRLNFISGFSFYIEAACFKFSACFHKIVDSYYHSGWRSFWSSLTGRVLRALPFKRHLEDKAC